MYCEVVFSTCEPEIRDKSKGPRIPSNLHQGQRSELLKVLLQQRSRITSFVIRPEARVIQDVTARKKSRSAPRLRKCFFNSPTTKSQIHRCRFDPESKPNHGNQYLIRSVSSVADSFWKIYRGQIWNLVVLCGFALFNSKARCNSYFWEDSQIPKKTPSLRAV